VEQRRDGEKVSRFVTEVHRFALKNIWSGAEEKGEEGQKIWRG